MQLKLVTLTLLERAAALARRLRLGFAVDALAPQVARPFERFELDVDGVRLRGRDLTQLLQCAGASRDDLLAWIGAHGFEAAWIDETSGRERPLSDSWSDDYVNLVCRRPR